MKLAIITLFALVCLGALIFLLDKGLEWLDKKAQEYIRRK
jgi:hypothetical protein